jgi:hypothetical protein
MFGGKMRKEKKKNSYKKPICTVYGDIVLITGGDDPEGNPDTLEGVFS